MRTIPTLPTRFPTISCGSEGFSVFGRRWGVPLCILDRRRHRCEDLPEAKEKKQLNAISSNHSPTVALGFGGRPVFTQNTVLTVKPKTRALSMAVTAPGLIRYCRLGRIISQGVGR